MVPIEKLTYLEKSMVINKKKQYLSSNIFFFLIGNSPKAARPMHLHFVAETDGPDGTTAVELRRLDEEIRSVEVGNFTSVVIVISNIARVLLLLFWC